MVKCAGTGNCGPAGGWIVASLVGVISHLCLPAERRFLAGFPVGPTLGMCPALRGEGF